MRSWQIGDRAILTGMVYHAAFNGTEVTILSALRPHSAVDYMVHEIDIVPPAGHSATIHPKYLRPIPDEYDGLSVTTWDECPFKPMVTV